MHNIATNLYNLLHLSTRGLSILEDIKQGRHYHSSLFTAVIILGAGIYGIAMGSFNGGIQIIYVLLKLPLLFLSTLIITLIASFILDAILGSPLHFKQYIALILLPLAVTSLTLAPLSLILGFFILSSRSHDYIVLITTLLFAIAGFFGVYAFFIARRYIHPSEKKKRRIIALIIWLIIYGFVGLQMAWLLKPWIGLFLDKTKPVPFLRETIKGNVYFEIYKAYDRLIKGKYY